MDAAVFALTVLLTGWRTQPMATAASLVGFAAGAVHSYLWNSRVTFRRGGSGRLGVARFAAATAFGAAISALLFTVAMGIGLPGDLRLAFAKIVATAGSMGVNFLVLRHWVFVVPRSTGEAAPELATDLRDWRVARAGRRLRLGTALRRPPEAPRLPAETRPWGRYAVLTTARDHQVKRLEVTPERRLSYQTHQFRAEHWYVVAGAGRAVLDGEPFAIEPGDTIDVAIGVAHRIENTGTDTLVIIEVQRGTYFGEDDIVRLDDDFGRTGTRPDGAAARRR